MKVSKTFRLDSELLNQMKTYCTENERSFTWVVEKGVSEFISGLPQVKKTKPASLPAVKEKRKVKEKFDASEVDFIGLNRNSWLEWVQYRKEKKKPITKAAAKKQVIITEEKKQVIITEESK